VFRHFFAQFGGGRGGFGDDDEEDGGGGGGFNFMVRGYLCV
jgi:hypothetical protein